MSHPRVRQAAFLLLTAVFAAGPMSAIDTLAQSATPAAGQSARATLPLTMQQAVDMALDANLGLKADKLAPAISAQDVVRAKASFIPTVGTGLQRNTKDQIPSSFVESTSSVVTSGSFGVSTGVSQLLPFYGANYQVTWTGGRNTTTANSTFNPLLSSNFAVTFSQPLLRGFKTDSARTNLDNAKRQAEITDVQLLESIAQTERSTRLAYLNLIIAVQSRNVAQQNLDVANAALRNSRARVQVGVAAPTDIVDAEASVASNEEALILAEGNIDRAMDQLRQLIFDPSRPDYWTVRLEPTDTVRVEPRAIDIDAAVKNALANRTDLIAARKNLEITSVNIDLLHNLTLPSVDLRVNYTGSGVAGTQFEFGSGFPPPVVSQTTRGFGSALADSLNFSYPSWTYGVQVSYPIGKSDSEASLTRARLQKQQAEIQLREAEQAVATAVRDAARQVETNYKRVQATRAALTAQEKRQEAEQKRFDVGLSDTFKLFQVQRDVAAARVAELTAELAYSQALINFEAVQRIR